MGRLALVVFASIFIGILSGFETIKRLASFDSTDDDESEDNNDGNETDQNNYTQEEGGGQ